MDKELAEFRSFNRYYTTLIGLLDKHYLNSEYSLTEVRILYELYYAANGITAKQLTVLLQLDKGYLSRILLQFEKKQLIYKEKSAADARSAYIRLTEKGKSAFEPLDQASQQQAANLLQALTSADVQKMLTSMALIKQIFNKVNT